MKLNIVLASIGLFLISSFNQFTTYKVSADVYEMSHWNGCWDVSDEACGGCSLLEKCSTCINVQARFHSYMCEQSMDLIWWYVLMPIILFVLLFPICIATAITYKKSRENIIITKQINDHANTMIQFHCTICKQIKWFNNIQIQNNNNNNNLICQECIKLNELDIQKQATIATIPIDVTLQPYQSINNNQKFEKSTPITNYQVQQSTINNKNPFKKTSISNKMYSTPFIQE